MLQTNARFCDPLGLYSPVSAVGKIFFQETWCRGMQWEESLPHYIGARWHAWITSLSLPHWMGNLNGHGTQVHVFFVTPPKGLMERSCTLDLLDGRVL